jgi:hypothetical protein
MLILLLSRSGALCGPRPNNLVYTNMGLMWASRNTTLQLTIKWPKSNREFALLFSNQPGLSRLQTIFHIIRTPCPPEYAAYFCQPDAQGSDATYGKRQ